MNLRTIPAGVAFLPTLAALWQEVCAAQGRPLHDGLILLPTRRAARALAAAFLDAAAGASMLLPRILALGGLDEAPLALAGALDLPPAITEPHRLAVLGKLILGMGGRFGAPAHADTAWALARELATLMDEAERAGIDLAAGLRRAADPAHALHWEKTLSFLEIVTAAWPAYLAEQGLINPAARQSRLLAAQAHAFRTAPPGHPVLAVANAGDIPAVASLLRAVAEMPGGMVVLPGLDLRLPDDLWEQLDEAHPQHGLRHLLHQMGATRGDATAYGTGRIPHRRADLLRLALLPATALAHWQHPFSADRTGLHLLSARDQQHEATAIALILRNALENPGATAALVTPDRQLAARVAAELGRWGVVADDSAGEPLAETPPAVFLRLIAAALAARLAPVALLAVLKHPLAALGLPPAELRRRARTLERFCLRGPAPPPGLAGLKRAVDRTPDDARRAPLADLLDRLKLRLEPALRTHSALSVPPAELQTTLIQAAEALAETDVPGDGPARLWALEEGEALAQLLAEAQEALPALPDDRPACLPGLLDAVLAGAVVRSRRALRGHGNAGEVGAGQVGVEHPRVFIWGLLEARLQSADVMVLGGLNDGIWPPATDPGPWMSRPMRASAGLPSPELRVGQAAHDFCMAACAAPLVVLSAPGRRDSAPAVPSRWLTRLAALLRRDGGLAEHPAAAWANLLDQPAAGPRPAGRPRPRPPVPARPRRLNVTDIATLLRDPYEIYARRVLGLEPLDPLEQQGDFRDYGTIVHRGLDAFLRHQGIAWPDDAAALLEQQLHIALRQAGVRPALASWWSPRLARIAAWVDAEERSRRAGQPLRDLATEASGDWVLHRPGGDFTLRGRADRIEQRADGSVVILDYKTGTLPTQEDVGLGRQPQLALEGAMLQAGAFGPQRQGSVVELTYWKLNGSHQPGEAFSPFHKQPNTIPLLVEEAGDQLAALIDQYDTPEATYPASLATPREYARPYAHLARAAEWGGAQDEDAEAP